MAFSTRKTIGAVLGAVCLTAIAAPASAGMMSVPPLKDVSLTAPVTDVAYRARHVAVRHTTVRRHYVGARRYGRYVRHGRVYYRRYGYGAAFPAAALGLVGAALGAGYYNNCYDGYGYGYGYGYGCGYYPSYGYDYGYGYPYYSYGYPAYYGGRRFYGGRGFYGNRVVHYGGGGFGGPRVAHFGGGGMRVGGGGFGGRGFVGGGGGRGFAGGGGFGGGRGGGGRR